MQPMMTRRQLLQAAGAASATLLFSRTIAAAESVAGGGETGLKGQPGLQISITAVTAHMLRINVAAVDETLDTYYNDGSLADRTFAKSLHCQRTDGGASSDIPWIALPV